MGQYFQYFVASADEAAACAADGPAEHGLPQVELKYVDPVVLLGHLTAAATGEEFSVEGSLEAFADEEPSPEERLLVRVPDDQVAALAQISDEQVTPLAVEWATSEFWCVEEDPDELARTVQELRSLARSATQAEWGMYAWALI
jgi:hypothetical protein